MNLPKMARVRQSFSQPTISDLPTRVHEELSRIYPDPGVFRNKRVGITAGSRGITNIAVITRAVIDFFQQAGAQPFVIPAMGSHGGATAEGQEALLDHYGINRETMGVPIESTMETVDLGVADDITVRWSVPAAEADEIFLVNRVKAHTNFRGVIESGLCKIAAIGLGKQIGAEEYHRRGFPVMADGILTVTGKLLELSRITGGLAIIENAEHTTSELCAVLPDELISKEQELLKLSKSLMPGLLLPEIDVLYVREMGKNIAGSGMDPNIIARKPDGYRRDFPGHSGMTCISQVVVSDLTDESDGNAAGLGLAEQITERLQSKINFEATLINLKTSAVANEVEVPPVAPNDQELLGRAIASCPLDGRAPLIVFIKNTLELTEMLVSENVLTQLLGNDSVEQLSPLGALEFDSAGYLTCFAT